MDMVVFFIDIEDDPWNHAATICIVRDKVVADLK
jgi:hypothetical protein